jgi:hypothetical protein
LLKNVSRTRTQPGEARNTKAMTTTNTSVETRLISVDLSAWRRLNARRPCSTLDTPDTLDALDMKESAVTPNTQVLNALT